MLSTLKKDFWSVWIGKVQFHLPLHLLIFSVLKANLPPQFLWLGYLFLADSPCHLPHTLLPMTILPWDIALRDTLELTLGKAGKIYSKHASRNILVTKGYSTHWSYCEKGENICSTGKEGEGAILCFVHQLVLGKGKISNCSLSSWDGSQSAGKAAMKGPNTRSGSRPTLLS